MPVPTAHERRFVLRLKITEPVRTQTDTTNTGQPKTESVKTNTGEPKEGTTKTGGTVSSWGFSLDESVGHHDEPVAAVSALRACRYNSAVLDAVTASGYAAAAVSNRRRRPFNLLCEPGVRLALLVLACEPVRKPHRRQAISQGIQAMTTEEALYWYALVRGESGPRALKAVRTLLAAL